VRQDPTAMTRPVSEFARGYFLRRYGW